MAQWDSLDAYERHIRVKCPQCGWAKTFVEEKKPELEGKRLRCPECGTSFKARKALVDDKIVAKDDTDRHNSRNGQTEAETYRRKADTHTLQHYSYCSRNSGRCGLSRHIEERRQKKLWGKTQAAVCLLCRLFFSPCRVLLDCGKWNTSTLPCSFCRFFWRV